MLNLQTPSLKTLASLGAAALLTLPLAAAAQNVYRCPGPDGRYNYTDKPCNGSRLRIKSGGIGTSVKHDPVMTSTTVRTPSTTASAAAAAPAAAPAASAAASAAPAQAASAAPAASVAAPTPAASAAPAPAPTPAKPTAQGVQL